MDGAQFKCGVKENLYDFSWKLQGRKSICEHTVRMFGLLPPTLLTALMTDLLPKPDLVLESISEKKHLVLS